MLIPRRQGGRVKHHSDFATADTNDDMPQADNNDDMPQADNNDDMPQADNNDDMPRTDNTTTCFRQTLVKIITDAHAYIT